MLSSCFTDMADDQNSRGRSAGRQPASKQRPSSTRRLSFSWTSSDPVSTPETDSIDYSTFLPLPLFVPRALPSTSEDIFPPLNRTDRFRPPTPPLLTPKQSAQRYLRTARLALLRLLNHQHSLVARVTLNGSLKRSAFLTCVGLSPTENRLAQPGPNTSAKRARRTARHRTGLSNKIRSDNHGNRAEPTFEELLENDCSTTQLTEAYMRQAKKEEVKRRRALTEEVRKANAQLEMEICGPRGVFDRCAALADELEEDMMFPTEIGIAI